MRADRPHHKTPDISSTPPSEPFMSYSRSPTAETTAWKPSVNPWLIAAAVMLATILEVLDTSVANVALPNMAGSLAASLDEATWVLTSYLVANAIVLPMTGWLSSFFGRKRFLIACIALFSLSSAACGIANSMGLLILARVVQGAAGGALLPISQAILMESFPPAKRGVAMAVYRHGRGGGPDFRARCWAAGSPTTIPGDGSSSLTSLSASWRC